MNGNSKNTGRTDRMGGRMKYKKCIVCGEEFEGERILGYCDECLKEKQNNRYVIEVKREEGEYASLYYSKNYGNHSGGAMGIKSKEELIRRVKKIKKNWESYDSIARREGDKVTKENLYFYSFTDEVKKMELLGMKRLSSF